MLDSAVFVIFFFYRSTIKYTYFQYTNVEKNDQQVGTFSCTDSGNWDHDINQIKTPTLLLSKKKK